MKIMGKLSRIRMAELSPEERVRNFNEVALGYTSQEAIAEAKRCIQCKNPECISGCPVEIDIPKFIKEIAVEKFNDAIKTIKDKNNLPAICGRVCPQETQCEIKCILGKKGDPVAIGALERFAADWQIKNVPEAFRFPHLNSGIINGDLKTSATKVAVVGSGPAGLTCAADLARAGVQVTIFEA
ncbi:MAG: NAD(P)-binding protein, partial [Elusimicrobiota bacterium]|nr:NAD(P)-binding protein [Elusimicrobiota bacterium]